VRSTSRALRQLTAEGLLSRSRRRLRVAVWASRPRSSLVLIARGDEREQIGGVTPRSYTMLRELESACRRRGLCLEIVPFTYTHESRFFRRLAALEQRGTVLGFHVWTVGIESGNSVGQARRIVERLAAYGRPLAVLREAGTTFPLREWTSGVPAALWSVAASSRDGELMGRFLLSCGYRSVTIVAEDHDRHIGDLRIEGITRAYRAAGLTQAVAVARLRTGLMAGRTAEQAEEGARRNSRRLPADVIAFMRNLSGLSTTALREAGVEGGYRRSYSQLLKTHGQGVWVCTTDPLALGALRFLSEARIHVPRVLSIAGFDDSPSAFLRGLTSYNFSTQDVVTMMVNHVLAPRLTPQPPSGEICLEGFVGERSSTCRLRTGRTRN